MCFEYILLNIHAEGAFEVTHINADDQQGSSVRYKNPSTTTRQTSLSYWMMR